MRKISQDITMEEISKWERSKGNAIIINAGTGMGKSYFIRNTFYNHCKKHDMKVLFLTNRTNTNKQIKDIILDEGKNDVIKTMAYHAISFCKLEKDIKKIDLSKYDYIVCDEHQFFLEDASFNRYTDIVYEEIMNSDARKIFMSATADYMDAILKIDKRIEIIKEYIYKKDFSHIDEVVYFEGYKELEEVVNLYINNNTKAIVFIDSSKICYELYQKFQKYSMFVCGKGSKEYSHVDEEKLKNLVNKSRFDDLILFTTTALDSGMSIVDEQVNNIVVSVSNIDTAIQCIGRKRLTLVNEKISIMLDRFNNNRLGGRLSNIVSRLEPADHLKKFGQEDFVKEYYKKDILGGLIYDEVEYDENLNPQVVKKVNRLMYLKLLIDRNYYKKLIKLNKEEKKEGFAMMFARRIGTTKDGIIHYMPSEVIHLQKKLKDILEELVGKEMYKDDIDKERLIDTINLKDSAGNVCRGYKSLNSYLEEMNYPYSIQTKRDNRKKINGKDNPNYKKTYWFIQSEEK